MVRENPGDKISFCGNIFDLNLLVLWNLMRSFNETLFSFYKKLGLWNNLSMNRAQSCIFYFFSWRSSTRNIVSLYLLVLISLWNLIIALILFSCSIFKNFVYWSIFILDLIYIWILNRMISTIDFHNRTCIMIFSLFNNSIFIFVILIHYLLTNRHFRIWIVKNVDITMSLLSLRDKRHISLRL